jgi:pilus assembly protein CpaC
MPVIGAFLRALALLLLLPAGPLLAQQTVTLDVGDGVTLRLGGDAAAVFVGNPAVADIQPVSAGTVFVTGVSAGSTTVFALDAGDREIASYVVRVRPEGGDARAILGGAAPGVAVTDLGNAAVLSGQAGSVAEGIAVLEARRSLEAQGRQVIDRTTAPGGRQVALRVRFAEIAREDVTRLGFDLSALGLIGDGAIRIVAGGGIADGFLRAGITAAGSDGSIDAALDALERVGVVNILSEPTLTTVSGRRARFRAGGEFAFPIAQGDGVITAGFRETGVTLDFLPIVLPNDRLSIEVQPEVSFIDESQGVQVEGFNVPSLTVRSADTTVEVASGQTFAIAGLYERFASDVGLGVPGLRSARGIGGLFGNRDQRRRERELVIFITPIIVDASDASRALAGPTIRVPMEDRVGFIVK